MKELIILLEAIKDIDNSAFYYRTQEAGLETSFINEIESAISKIQENPERYSIYRKKYRKFVVMKFPFTIFFKIITNLIIVIAVSHHSRHPDYWKYRI
jgi:hypothetical protein